MIKIRKNIFETNSSSTHMLAIHKHSDYTLPDHLRFDFGEFGWSYETYHDTKHKASYIITVLFSLTKDITIEYVQLLGDILKSYGIMPSFPEPEWDEEYKMWDKEDYGYVDHAYEAAPFVQYLLENPDKLIVFLFDNNSYITTGNDNEHGCMLPSGEFQYGDDRYEDGYNKDWDSLLEKEEEDYEIFYKGN